MIVPFLILQNVTAAVQNYLPDARVFRSRARSVGDDTEQAVIVRIEQCSGLLYTVGGGVEWSVTLSLNCFSRNGDQDCAEMLEAAHQGLLVDQTFSIDGLFFDPAFTVTVDSEDTDEALSAMSALYNFKITTENSGASIA